MELRDILNILARRKWVIMLVTAVTIIVVVIGTLLIKPSYTATSTLRIATSAAALVSSSDYLYADRLINTYIKIATSTPILSELKKQLNSNTDPQVVVKTVTSTELIQISVEDHNPQLAKDAANGLAQILVEQSGEFYSGGGKSPLDTLRDQLTQVETELNQARQDYADILANEPENKDKLANANKLLDIKQQIYASLLQQYEQARLRDAIRSNIVSIVEPATLPQIPSKPNKLLNIALGVVFGLTSGLGLAFLIDGLDTTLYTTEQIEKATNFATLGRIPLSKESYKNFEGTSPFSEAFHQLTNNLLIISSERSLQTLLVTSPEPREGKSTVAAFLAYSLSQAGKRVLVVDCDMRVPTVHKKFNVPNKIGLSNILKKSNTSEDVIQGSRYIAVNLITSGPIPQNPVELLGSPQMKELVKSLSKQYDVVILDSPCLLPVADAGVIAPLVDGVLMVARRGQTTRAALRIASEQLIDQKAKVLGLVVNGDSHTFRYQYYSQAD